MTRRRLRTALIAGAAALTLAAAPAYGHFCSKSGWNAKAQEHAANSPAWISAEEWQLFIGEAVEEGFICQDGADNLLGQIDAQPEDTLFRGPGILAGGQEYRANGRSKGPEHFHYLDIETAFAECE